MLFRSTGFMPKAMFDVNPKLIGLKIRDLEIMDADNIETFINENSIDIGVICTTKEHAQKIADRLVKCNIKGIWNFAPTDLEVPDDVMLENVHLSESLYTLSCMINHMRE